MDRLNKVEMREDSPEALEMTAVLSLASPGVLTSRFHVAHAPKTLVFAALQLPQFLPPDQQRQ